jgi:hypothetical protein
MAPVYYLPIFTCTLSVIFSVDLFLHWRKKPGSTYLLWWFLGVLTFGAGTFTESWNTLMGWSETNFRWWYITGALLGGAPLAQGTVYLLLPKRAAHILTAVFLIVLVIASVAVLRSPIDMSMVEPERMSGKVFEWQWVRAFSPFINLYAVLFLIGVAAWSAYGYFKKGNSALRAWGNILIMVGAILPGIGGTMTRYGHVEWLYVTELIGLTLIYIAYRMIRADRHKSIHKVQVVAE